MQGSLAPLVIGRSSNLNRLTDGKLPLANVANVHKSVRNVSGCHLFCANGHRYGDGEIVSY